jgi:serine/threonine-protein kinase
MNPATEAPRAAIVQEAEHGCRRFVDVSADETLVMERFRLLERIGSGGMGTVYRAFDERLQREVAVKEVHAADPQRILREAQAAARLNHPGIVTLYELGERKGSALLVSELVPGETLDQLRARGALADRDLGEIAADLCAALAHAHSRGVVHRDIKPQNVIVRGEAGVPGAAKLMDFGIARIAGAPTLTADGEVVGTLAYMSPEQAEGRTAGPETDVYSLALTLHECFVGSNPVAGPTPAATARRIGGPLSSLRESRPDLPEGLTDLLDSCLDPEPELRPTAAELGECIEAEIAGLDPGRALPRPDGIAEVETPASPSGRVARVALVVAMAASITLLAGPLGAGGLALVASVLLLPLAAIGTRSALAAAVAPLLGALGLAPAAAALGAAAPTAATRGALGAASWVWIVAGSVILGIGPELGFAEAAPAGWTSDAASTTDALLGALLAPESLLASAVFAAAAVALGWVLSVGHAAIALLGAMVWAALAATALSVLADGALATSAVPVVIAAAVAVALAFGLPRGHRALGRERAQARDPELGGAQFSEQLA